MPTLQIPSSVKVRPYKVLALIASMLHGSLLAPLIDWVHRLCQDLLFTFRIMWPLHFNPRNRAPVLYKALRQHSGASVACCYTLRGRVYFLKQPSQIRSVLTSKSSFEKLKSPKGSPIGKILGEAITASGDDPITWKAAKRFMRESVHMPSMIPAFRLIGTSITQQADTWTQAQHPNGVLLYRSILSTALQSSYKAFFGVNLQEELAQSSAGYTLDEYVDLVDLISNTYLTAKDKLDDQYYCFIRRFGKELMAKAPKESFGQRIQQMAEDQSHPEFTTEMGIGNAMFYVHALPVMTSIVLHWSIYMLQVRHPHHLERIQEELASGDKTYFRMCLKEVIRLYHPAVFMARRVKETTVLDGVTLKKRSLVMPWAKLVEQDLTFKPQRWEGNEQLFDEVTDDVGEIIYAPLGFGARSCLGKELVITMFEENVAEMLQKYDFDLLEEDPWKGDVAPALQHNPDVMIGFRPNQDLHFSVKLAN